MKIEDTELRPKDVKEFQKALKNSIGGLEIEYLQLLNTMMHLVLNDSDFLKDEELPEMDAAEFANEFMCSAGALAVINYCHSAIRQQESKV